MSCRRVFFSCKPPQCRMHRRELCTTKGKERANVAVMQIYKYLTAFSSDSPEEIVVMWLQRRLHCHYVFFVKFNRRATCRISNILRNICPFQLSETESSRISRVQSKPALKCCLSCRRRSRRCWRRHLSPWVASAVALALPLADRETRSKIYIFAAAIARPVVRQGTTFSIEQRCIRNFFHITQQSCLFADGEDTCTTWNAMLSEILHRFRISLLA